MDLSVFRGARYISSHPSYHSAPQDGIPIIVFIGRSNSGKSSLISALCGHKNLARSSSEPGKTRLLNYFEVPFKSIRTEKFYIVDTPGYGYAKISKSEKKKLREMVDDFLLNEKEIRLILLILDARRKLGEEEMNILNYCRDHGLPYLFVRTKWDTLNQKEKSAAAKAWKKEGIQEDCKSVSSVSGEGIEKVFITIQSILETDSIE